MNGFATSFIKQQQQQTHRPVCLFLYFGTHVCTQRALSSAPEYCVWMRTRTMRARDWVPKVPRMCIIISAEETRHRTTKAKRKTRSGIIRMVCYTRGAARVHSDDIYHVYLWNHVSECTPARETGWRDDDDMIGYSYIHPNPEWRRHCALNSLNFVERIKRFAGAQDDV